MMIGAEICLGYAWLLAGRRINDTKARMSETYIPFGADTQVIRTSVVGLVNHARERNEFHRFAVEIEKSC